MRTITTIVLSLLFTTNISGQGSDSSLKITRLTGDFYVFTTYQPYQGSRISANGLYLVPKEGAVLLDTPWDTTQFQPLIDHIYANHGKKVVLVLATHFHEDRTAGLEYFRRQGAKTYTTVHTDSLSKIRGMKRAEFLMKRDTVFRIGGYSFKVFYPGHGHAPDNIVIWFDRERIIYGGCLIKSVEDNNLGNLSDASVKKYASTLKKVQDRFRNPKYIIPGHNDWTNKGSLKHSLKMARLLKKSEAPR